VSTGYWLKYTHSCARAYIQIYAHTRPAGVCDIVVPCKSTPYPSLPRRASIVDRVNHVKSVRHTSRSNRLTDETPNALIRIHDWRGMTVGGRVFWNLLLGSTPRKRIDGPSALLFAGVRPILCHPREYLAVKFIFFLVEQCNQPWHLQNYATQVERRNERRFLAWRSLDGGYADANRGRKFVAPMESASEERGWEEKESAEVGEGVIFRFYVECNLRP